MHSLTQKWEDLKSEKDILEQQSKILSEYSSTLKANVADGSKLAQFLELYKERRTEILSELESLKAEIGDVESQMADLRKEFWADDAGRKRQTKVTVVVLAQQKGKAELSLRYSECSMVVKSICMCLIALLDSGERSFLDASLRPPSQHIPRPWKSFEHHAQLQSINLPKHWGGLVGSRPLSQHGGSSAWSRNTNSNPVQDRSTKDTS